jgi:hypothetical protein
MHLDITPNHVVILRDGEDSLLRLDTARNLVVGDNMVASDGG